MILFNRAAVAAEETKPAEADNLLAFCRTPRSRQEIADYLGIKATPYMMNKYVLPLIQQGLLRMTIPDKPKSRNQRYYAVEQ